MVVFSFIFVAPKEKKKIQKKVKKPAATKPEKPKKGGKKKGKSVSSKTSQDGKDDDAKSKAESEKKEEEEEEKKEEEEAKEEEKEEGEEEEREDEEEEDEESRASPESPEFIFIHDVSQKYLLSFSGKVTFSLFSNHTVSNSEKEGRRYFHNWLSLYPNQSISWSFNGQQYCSQNDLVKVSYSQTKF